MNSANKTTMPYSKLLRVHCNNINLSARAYVYMYYEGIFIWRHRLFGVYSSYGITEIRKYESTSVLRSVALHVRKRGRKTYSVLPEVPHSFHRLFIYTFISYLASTEVLSYLRTSFQTICTSINNSGSTEVPSSTTYVQRAYFRWHFATYVYKVVVSAHARRIPCFIHGTSQLREVNNARM